METFTEIREFVYQNFNLVHDEPFLIGIEVAVGEHGRRQSLFMAELKGNDGGRFLRVETTIAPLEEFDAEKCLRLNLMQRTGYLAVGDLNGVPYIKMCENIPYGMLKPSNLVYTIERMAPRADEIERALSGDDVDIS